MSCEFLPLVPEAKWRCSTSPIRRFTRRRRLRNARSRAIPAPLIPPPRISTSKGASRSRPIFPDGLTAITNEIGFQCESGKVVYCYGHLPVFQHDTDDVRSFRLFTSQLIDRGTVRQADVVKAFGVPLITVKRYVKVLREQGSKGFYAPRKYRSAPVLTGKC